MLGKPNRVKTRYIKGVGVKGEKRQHHCTLVEILRIYSCFNLPMYCLFSIALFDSYKSPTLRFLYAICKGKLLKHHSEIYGIDFFPFKELPLHVSNSQEQSPIQTLGIYFSVVKDLLCLMVKVLSPSGIEKLICFLVLSSLCSSLSYVAVRLD